MKSSEIESGQYPPEYFDEGFFTTGMAPPKGATRGVVSPHDKTWVSAVLQIFGEKGYSFLDAGCGMGWVVMILRDLGEAAWGFDISKYAIENSVMPEFVQQSDIAFVDLQDHFDIVLCNRVLCYLSGEEAILQALANLKKLANKQLVIAVSAADHMGPGNAERALKSRAKLWPKAQWSEWFKAAGLIEQPDLMDQIMKPRHNWDCIWVLRKEKDERDSQDQGAGDSAL